jgi:hypothetical protein
MPENAEKPRKKKKLIRKEKNQKKRIIKKNNSVKYLFVGKTNK